jgi:hypothetical protein
MASPSAAYAYVASYTNGSTDGAADAIGCACSGSPRTA